MPSLLRICDNRKVPPLRSLCPNVHSLANEGLEARPREDGSCSTDNVCTNGPLAGMSLDCAGTQERFTVKAQDNLYHCGTYAPTIS